ncbi:MAG: acetyl/propionyl/methylcrotonyl-CoA carboxylase subunit alpha [Pseudomonadota bacterium]
MFEKILIANRGEIACRVMKTARRLGIKTVAVYSDADRDALHVEMADEAIHIGPPAAAESYLVIDRIIDACTQTGAQAVHPGYGFLSEREAFPRALADAGVTFIGPNPHAIAAMGDKIESKRMAAAAGVSTVPGYVGEIATPEEAVEIANGIGYPVIIKASAGGGGKGMRIAASADEVADGFALAKSEAKSSFGDDRVFIEKFITNPRHIEIQVLGDKHGNIIHLGERECSIQRRNQKVIEEAPSPLLDEATREKMGAQAKALGAAVDYDSAGTVEFVEGQDQSFYFLEMNTRLQVEHPVTELITGVDLVEQMIRVAAGEELSLKQADVTLTGWAVESRIYAEDPFRNFLPSIGRLTGYRPPAERTDTNTDMCGTIRNDTGVVEGGEISMFYDPMIAKLVTHAPTRIAAIDLQADALDAFYLDGIQHNIPFLTAIMQHPRWRSGDLSTGFIVEEFPDGFTGREGNDEERAILSAVAASIDHMSNQRRRQISHQMTGPVVGFSLDRIVAVGDARYAARVTGIDEQTTEVALSQLSGQADADKANGAGAGARGTAAPGAEPTLHTVKTDWWFGQPVWFGAINGRAVAVQVRAIPNGYQLSYRGIRGDTFVYTAREAALSALMPVKEAPDLSRFLLCPMPGLVKAVNVSEGDAVFAGDALAVVEAMKMENVLRAERDATVEQVAAKAGDSLAVDDVIMTFASSDKGSA